MALRYRLAGKVVARAVGCLRDIIATIEIMLSQKKDDVGRVVQEIGGTLYVPDMDGDRICMYFGRHRKAESAVVLEKIDQGGVPAELRLSSNLESVLECDFH